MLAHNKKNERIGILSTECCVLLLDLFVTLQQSDSSVDKRMANYWAGIWKLLPRDRKKCCTAHSNDLGCNQITKFTSKF